MQKDKQEKVDKIKRLIEQARKVRDDDTVKALNEMMFELTGEKEPEFAAEELSGNPKLDKLRKHLVNAIKVHDDECEANLREMIAAIVKSEEVVESMPEMAVELTAEDIIENPFDIPEVVEEPVIKESLTTEPVQKNYTDEALDGEWAPLDSRFAPNEPLSIEVSMKDVLSSTQIAALRKEGFLNEFQLKKLIKDWPGEEKIGLMRIKGVGPSTADAILEKLGYEG